MKNGVAKLLGCVFAGCMTLCVLAGVLGAHGAGSGSDPLITYSYVQTVFLGKLKSGMTGKAGELLSAGNRSNELDSHGKTAVGSMNTDWSADTVAGKLVSGVTSLSAPSVTELRKIVLGADRSLVASQGAALTVLNGSVDAVSDGKGSIILVKDKAEYSGEKKLVAGDYAVVSEKGEVHFYASEETVVMVSGRVILEKNDDVVRIYGKDRYITAFSVADELKSVMGIEKFENVVVASGLDFADALSGSYLANVKNAPILLVHPIYIDSVKSYIRENLVSGGTVYILGGPNAVSTDMDTGLDGFNVKRLQGANRYDTNLEILKEAGISGRDILVCTGLNFADGLSSSALNRPILLVSNNRLTDTQKAFLSENSGSRIYIVGGPNAINETIETELKAYGEVSRIYGANRYETSANLAKTFYPNAKSAVLAYGQNFPDGLGGGCLAYRMSGPILLAMDNYGSYAESYVATQNIRSGVVLGGGGLISDATVCKILGMPQGAVVTVK